MAINDVLSALAEKLGLKTTRLQDLHVLREKVEDDIRRNQDKLGDLKNEVADLDAKLRAKKKEYDAAGPGIRQIIKRDRRSHAETVRRKTAQGRRPRRLRSCPA